MMLKLVHHFSVASFFIRRLINSTTRLKINFVHNTHFVRIVHNQ